MRKVAKGNVVIKLWDVGGQKRFRSLWERYCRRVDAIVFVVDASEGEESLTESKAELDELLAKTNGVPLLVLGNKNDLPGLSLEQLIERFELKAIKDREVGVYSISAKNRTNIDVTLKWLMRFAHAPSASKT